MKPQDTNAGKTNQQRPTQPTTNTNKPNMKNDQTKPANPWGQQGGNNTGTGSQTGGRK